MTRTIGYDVKPDLKLVHITVKRLAETPIRQGDVVSIGSFTSNVIPCTNATVPFGVACNAVSAEAIAAYEAGYGGEDYIEVIVCLSGVCPVLAGEPLSENTWVGVDSDSRVIDATSVSMEIIGFTLHNPAGDGVQTSIFVHRVPPGARGGK